MGARRKSRELAVQMLYQHDLSGNDPESIVTGFEELQKVKATVRDFAVKLFRGALQKLDEIDAVIVEQAANWRIERMPAVDRNILRMAIYELRFEDDTPRLVIIDEAIEIAKKFSTEKSSQFINGILDGILRRYNPGQAPKERSRSTN